MGNCEKDIISCDNLFLASISLLKDKKYEEKIRRNTFFLIKSIDEVKDLESSIENIKFSSKKLNFLSIDDIDVISKILEIYLRKKMSSNNFNLSIAILHKSSKEYKISKSTLYSSEYFKYILLKKNTIFTDYSRIKSIIERSPYIEKIIKNSIIKNNDISILVPTKLEKNNIPNLYSLYNSFSKFTKLIKDFSNAIYNEDLEFISKFFRNEEINIEITSDFITYISEIILKGLFCDNIIYCSPIMLRFLNLFNIKIDLNSNKSIILQKVISGFKNGYFPFNIEYIVLPIYLHESNLIYKIDDEEYIDTNKVLSKENLSTFYFDEEVDLATFNYCIITDLILANVQNYGFITNIESIEDDEIPYFPDIDILRKDLIILLYIGYLYKSKYNLYNQ